MYLLFSLLKFLSGRLGLLQEASLESLELWLALFSIRYDCYVKFWYKSKAALVVWILHPLLFEPGKLKGFTNEKKHVDLWSFFFDPPLFCIFFANSYLFVFDFTHVWGDALGVSSGLWRAFCQVLRVG